MSTHALALVPDNAAQSIEKSQHLLDTLEKELFGLRADIEILWLRLGAIASEIVRKKLYVYRQDDDGNYFRTAKAYFQWLDAQFKQRGWSVSYTTLNRYIADYRLVVEDLDLPTEDVLLLGKTNLEEMGAAVRHMRKEGKGAEAVSAFVTEVVEAARANTGLPVSQIREAVDEHTERTMKGLNVEFVTGRFGRKLSKLTLYWGPNAINLLTAEVTEEQKDWLCRRLGITPGTLH